MNRIILAGAFACALSACQTTAIDSRIAEVSDRLAARCVELQTATLAVDLLAPEKIRTAVADARAAFDRFCAKPPRSSAELLIAIADVIRARQAVDAAKRT